MYVRCADGVVIGDEESSGTHSVNQPASVTVTPGPAQPMGTVAQSTRGITAGLCRGGVGIGVSVGVGVGVGGMARV